MRVDIVFIAHRLTDGAVRFEPLFRSLYPPQEAGSSHGLSVYWEVQLLHDELVDQEIVCRDDCFEWEDFVVGSAQLEQAPRASTGVS